MKFVDISLVGAATTAGVVALGVLYLQRRRRLANMEPPLPDFVGDPADPAAPKPGTAPIMTGYPASWSFAVCGVMKMLRAGIDGGLFDDDKVEARLADFEKDGAAGLVTIYAQTRAALDGYAEKTDGWGCTHEEAVVGGVPCLWTSWPGTQPGAAPILWLHGGAFTVHSYTSYKAFAARLSKATSRRVCVPNYRLAPEHAHPAQLDDADRVWSEMGNGCGLGGDSAGGALALALMQRLVAQKRPTPPAAVLMAPWCDLSLTAASYAANHACDSVTRNMLRVGARVYSGALDPSTHPGVSPLLGDMAGLPPLLIQVGSCDALLDDSLALAQRVKAAGGTVTLDVAHAMPHVYAMIAAVCPRGQQAFEDAARVLTQ